MKTSLQKKCSLFFFFLLALFSHPAMASPTPTCPIVTERFQGLTDGTTVNNSSTGWWLDASQVAGSAYFAMKSNRFHAQELGGQGIWYSKVFSVTGYTDIQVAVKISSEGDMNSSEYVKLYYKINGGAEILLDSRTGNFGTIDFISPTFTANTVQLVVKIYNYNNGGSQTSKYYIEEYRVFKEHGPCASSIPVSAVAGNGGVVTCTNPSLTLSASTTASGTTTYSWTGPNSFTSTSQNPMVTVAGVYTVVGTNTAGTGSASVTVTANQTPPDLTATGGALACATNVVIHAASSVAGVTYSWTGPNGFTSTLQNPTVSVAGTYTVTARNPANGCTASQTATVTSGAATPIAFWSEDFSFTNGTTSDAGATSWTSSTSGTGTYSVQGNEFKTSFSGGAQGVWTSGVVDISTKSNVVISVDLRSETASGSDLFESDDYIRVYYKLNSGAETLIYEDMAGIGSTTSGTASFSLSSSAFNGSTLQVIIKTRNSDPTERYFFDNVKLTGTGSSTSVTTSVSGVATCTGTAQLFATATTATAYSWTGPNGFTSSAQNPVVSAGGQYIVTATLSSGCTATAPVTVTENKTTPDIAATGGTLACLTAINLNVNSSVTGATYSWSGPNSFSSTAKNPSVSTAGTYTAIVTDPVNGCTASASVQVISGAAVFWLEDFALSNGTTSDAGATSWNVQSTPASSVCSVQGNEFRVSNTGTPTGNESVWASAIINISNKTNISIAALVRSAITGSAVMNTSGTYMDYIRFYYKLNGGSEILFSQHLAAINNHSTSNTSVSVGSLNGTSLQIIVRARATGSDEFYYFDNIQVTGTGNVNATATANGKLTCTNPAVTLSGSSTNAGVTYSWSGPGGFISNIQNPSVSTVGIYNLTITDPSTGCTGTDTANVLQDMVTTDALASAAGQLSCTTTQVVLSGSSSAPGASYSWTGPGGFSSALQNPSVTIGGIYTLTVNTGGCSSTDTALVIQSSTAPGAIPSISSANTLLNCIYNFVRLDGNSSVPGVNYNWTMPNGSNANVKDISAYNPGVYTLTVTNPANGCISTAAITVIQDIAPPANLTVDPSITLLNCINTNVTINAASSTPGISYNWSGPNGFASSSASIMTNKPGAYILTVTNPANGCTNSTTAVVNQSVDKPANVTTTATPASGQITCIHPGVLLSGNSSTAGVTYAWTGPDNYSSSAANATATAAGNYRLIVTNPVNGCPDTANYIVTQNKNAPVGVVAGNSDQISCYTPSVFVMGSSTTPGATFSWTGPSGFIPASTANAETDIAGTYTLLVTNPVNGCTATAVAIVEDHTTPPAGVTAGNSGPLNCVNTSATLTGNSTTAGVDYTWVAPDEHLIPGAIVNVSTAGTYTLVVTDLDNGCVSIATTTVLQNTTGCTPGARVATSDTSRKNPEQKPAIGKDPGVSVTQFEYKTYPNPFSNTAFIEFRSPEPSRVTIELYNNKGLKEKVLFNSTVIPNQLYKIGLEAGSLVAGTYYCIIRSNDRVYSSKLIRLY